MKKSYFILDIEKTHVVYIGAFINQDEAIGSLDNTVGDRVRFLIEECLHSFKDGLNDSIEEALRHSNMSNLHGDATDITNIIPI